MMSVNMIITLCGFIINIGMLVWNMSKLNSRVQFLEKEQNREAAKFENFRKEYWNGHDNLRERFDNKLEDLLEKVDRKLDEQAAQIRNMVGVISRMEASLKNQ